MEKNIFLEIEYLGTGYFGFQVQNPKRKKEIAVQEVLEEALMKLFKRKIRIIYSSRTDRGVHAKAQAVNFKIDTKIPAKNIKVALNSFLPADIRIKKVKQVSLDFHARFWSKSKAYRYIILNKKEPSVFWKDFSWHIEKSLNLGNMEKASKKLIGRKDFSLFAKEAKKYKDCTRTVKSILIKKKGSFIYIDIEADGFLRNMARNIASFLVQTGSGKVSRTDKPAPACGLYLCKVNY